MVLRVNAGQWRRQVIAERERIGGLQLSVALIQLTPVPHENAAFGAVHIRQVLAQGIHRFNRGRFERVEPITVVNLGYRCEHLVTLGNFRAEIIAKAARGFRLGATNLFLLVFGHDDHALSLGRARDTGWGLERQGESDPSTGRALSDILTEKGEDATMTDRTTAIAKEIIRQHEAGEGFTNLSGDLAPRDINEAYAAQFRLHEIHLDGGRGPLSGRKIALASQVQQELCGVDHPLAGGIFEREIFKSGASLNLADYHGLGMEFELAVVLGRDLSPGDEPFDAAAMKDAAATIHPAFEMIVDRGADYANLNALTMAADNAWGAGIVLGPAIEGWREMDIDALPVSLHWNDEPPATAHVGDADPFGSLAWVATVLTNAGQVLKTGEVVITGSVIKTRAPLAGDQIRYDIGGLSAVEVSIT